MRPDATGADPQVTIVVLGGGLATRLPGKLALPIDGVPMLARVLRALSATGAPCLVSANAPLPDDVAALVTVPLVYDDHPGAGPLAALASAASVVTTPYFFAAAGDMPGIDAAFVARVIAAAEKAGWPDATVPIRDDEKLEPLAALYKTGPWLAAARIALAAGRRHVTAALDGLRTIHYRVVPEDEPALANVNTPAEYQQLQDATALRERRT
jgi:molybdopterin-guanine dinucleotide biosynthesis protein A